MSLLASSRDTSRWTFEKGAGFYDRSRIVNHFLSEWDNRILALKPATPLLDLGCATGRTLVKFIENGYTDVCGFDLSLNCLKILRGKFPDESPSLARGFIENLPYRNESFSSALLSGVLHHLEDPKEAFREIARVLKSSGKLFIAEPQFPIGIRQFINMILDIYPVTGDRRFYTPEIVTKIASLCGFRQIISLNKGISYILVLERC